jgi:hypothetical protein
MSENTFKPAEEPIDIAEVESRETTPTQPAGEVPALSLIHISEPTRR